MDKNSKIFIAGHKGLVGSAILRKLLSEGYTEIVVRTSSELDLRNQEKVQSFFSQEKPEYVFFAAGTVGGIMANIKFPADFIYNNIAMSANVVHYSYLNNVKKLLYLGSSCIYPKNSPQPIKEEYLLTGELEETNKPYAMSKLSGIEMCKAYNNQFSTDYFCLIPTNLFGINDNYDLEKSHLVAALIRKFHEAKRRNDQVVKLWGTGKVLREILCVDELADACLYFMNSYSGKDIINIGSGTDYSIAELAEMIKKNSGFRGNIEFDTSKPDGMKRKQLDVSKAASLGWKAKNNLLEDLQKSYDDFSENHVKYISSK